ncbi:hypothetical protein Tco_0848201 [Tanacetum coccineum]
MELCKSIRYGAYLGYLASYPLNMYQTFRFALLFEASRKRGKHSELEGMAMVYGSYAWIVPLSSLDINKMNGIWSLFVGLRKCPVQSGLKLIGTLLLLAHESLAPFGFCKQNCGVSSIYAIGKMQAVLTVITVKVHTHEQRSVAVNDMMHTITISRLAIQR